MISLLETKKNTIFYKILCCFIAFSFAFTLVIPPASVQAQIMPATMLNLPMPGAMVLPSAGFTPTLIKGITIYPDNPLMFDFIINTGDSGLGGDELRVEGNKLIKYFLASLTVPEDHMWVNLSPYEDDRIIPERFGYTEMGRDLLAQDYMLKQITASLMYPEDELGKEFWDRVYKRAQAEFGTTEIPMNTFNKVWIVPQSAVVYESGASAFIGESHLKVMLEEDYLALKSNLNNEKLATDMISEKQAEVISGVTSAIVREILIPEIEKEVNEGENFASLRQIYDAMILATWYKEALKESLLGQVYVDQNKVSGIDIEDKDSKRKIYEQYLEAFKQGVYDYIKEDVDPVTQEIIPRKYFSGGVNWRQVRDVVTSRPIELAPVEHEEQITRDSPKDHSFTVNVVETNEKLAKVAQDTGFIRSGAESQRAAQAQAPEVERAVLTALEKSRSLKIGDVGMSNRAINALTREGIYTLGDIASKTSRQLLSSRNFGQSSLIEVKEVLNRYNLSLLDSSEIERAVLSSRGSSEVDFGRLTRDVDSVSSSIRRSLEINPSGVTRARISELIQVPTKSREIADMTIAVIESDEVSFGVARGGDLLANQVVIERPFLDRINALGNPYDMLGRHVTYALAEGEHGQRKIAEYEYARENFTNLSQRLAAGRGGVDVESTFDGFMEDLFVQNDQPDEMVTEISKRLKESLWEIGTNMMNRPQNSSVRGRRVITNKPANDVDVESFRPFASNDPADGAEDIQVGILAISANPEHWGHTETALRAIATMDLDQVVIVVQGDDFRKPILAKTEEARHALTQLRTAGFNGLVTYSNWSKGNNNIGEVSTPEMMLANENRPGKVTWHYIVGNDHQHYFAPTGKDEQGIRRETKPGNGEQGFEPDTIQVLAKTRNENPEIKALIDNGKADLKVGFNIRDWQDGVPLDAEKEILADLEKQGFIYTVPGVNLPGVSSSKLRQVLAGQLPVSEATFITKSVYDFIMDDGKYRGLITDLNKTVRQMADKMESDGFDSTDSDFRTDMKQLRSWLDIETRQGRSVDTNEFYRLFYDGVEDQFNDKGEQVDFALSRERVRRVFEVNENMPVDLARLTFQNAVQAGREILRKTMTNISRGYDVRGLTKTEDATITPEGLYTAGVSVGLELIALEHITEERPLVIVTGDHRESTPELREAYIQGLTSQGIDVEYSDEQISTPGSNVIARLESGKYAAAIQITASHNAWTGAKPENGYKVSIRQADGQLRGVYGEQMARILNRSMNEEITELPEAQQGRVTRVERLPQYIQHIQDTFVEKLDSLGITLEEARNGLAVVVDTGNAVMGPIARAAIEEKLGIEYYGINDEVIVDVNGEPVHEADPSLVPVYKDLLPNAVQRIISDNPHLRNKLVLGIAFDGDGDRLGMTNDNGQEYLNPTKQGYLFYATMLKQNPNLSVVLDIRAGQEILELLGKPDGDANWHAPGWPVVRAAMQENDADIAVEASHHTMERHFKDKRIDAIDDGLFSALSASAQSLKLRKDGSSITELLDREWYPRLPEELRPTVNEDSFGERYEIMPEISAALTTEINNAFEGANIRKIPSPGEQGAVRLQVMSQQGEFIGWVLMRSSNTSPKLSIMAQAANDENMVRIAQILKDVLGRFPKVDQDAVNSNLGKVLDRGVLTSSQARLARRLDRQFNAAFGNRGAFEDGFFDNGAERGGWVQRPREIQESLITDVEGYVQELKDEGVENFVFFAMGGESSIIGPSEGNIINISSTSPRKMKRMLESIDLSKTRFFGVSKSFGTAETIQGNAKYVEEYIRAQGLNPTDYVTYFTDPGKAQDKLDEGYTVIRREQTRSLRDDSQATDNIGGRNTLVNVPTLISYAMKFGGRLKSVIDTIKNSHNFGASKASPFIEAAVEIESYIREEGRYNMALVQPEFIRQSRWLFQQQNPEESIGSEGAFTVYTSRPDLETLRRTGTDKYVFVEFRVPGFEQETESYIEQARADGHRVVTIDVPIKGDVEFAPQVTSYGWMTFVAALGAIWGENISTQPEVEEYKKLMRELELSLNNILEPAQASDTVLEFGDLSIAVDGVFNQLSGEQKSAFRQAQNEGTSAPALMAMLLRMKPDLDALTLAYYDDADQQTEEWLENLSQEVLHKKMGKASKWGEGTGVLHGIFVGWFSGPKHQIPTHIIATEHEQPEIPYTKGSEILIAGAAAAHMSLVNANRPSMSIIVNGELNSNTQGQIQAFYEGVAERLSPVTSRDTQVQDVEIDRARFSRGIREGLAIGAAALAACNGAGCAVTNMNLQEMRDPVRFSQMVEEKDLFAVTINAILIENRETMAEMVEEESARSINQTGDYADAENLANILVDFQEYMGSRPEFELEVYQYPAIFTANKFIVTEDESGSVQLSVGSSQIVSVNKDTENYSVNYDDQSGIYSVSKTNFIVKSEGRSYLVRKMFRLFMVQEITEAQFNQMRARSGEETDRASLTPTERIAIASGEMSLENMERLSGYLSASSTLDTEAEKTRQADAILVSDALNTARAREQKRQSSPETDNSRLPGQDRLGGIDLNPEMLDLQIKRDGNGIPLPMNQQPIGDMEINGFLPVIINVVPVNVPLLLGFADIPGSDTADSNINLDPADLKAKYEFSASIDVGV